MNPDELIGREVAFVWLKCHHKPVPQKGKIINVGRVPGTVIIEADPRAVKAPRNERIRGKQWNNHGPTRALHCRPLSEIEVLA